MWGNISLGKVFGIPLQLPYTWFIIFVMVSFSLVLYPLVGPPYPPIEQRIILGVLTSLLFFASIIVMNWPTVSLLFETISQLERLPSLFSAESFR
jgi:hypothetical protein